MSIPVPSRGRCHVRRLPVPPPAPRRHAPKGSHLEHFETLIVHRGQFAGGARYRHTEKIAPGYGIHRQPSVADAEAYLEERQAVLRRTIAAFGRGRRPEWLDRSRLDDAIFSVLCAGQSVAAAHVFESLTRVLNVPFAGVIREDAVRDQPEG